MQTLSFRADPRWFQLLFQCLFLSYGLFVLGWQDDHAHYIISITGCLLFGFAAESIFHRQVQALRDFKKWGFSVLISSMSLCLLLKTNAWYISLIAAFLTVIPKYIFRIRGSHFFNPSAIGIIGTIVLTGQAWLSPGQWGSGTVIFFGAITLGTIVVTRVQKLDVSLAFLLTYAGLMFWRQVIVLGWPADYFMHTISTGSLLLFSFFMISDPKTAPRHPLARIVWAMLIAIAAFYLAAFKWKYNTAIWMLVVLAPLVPVLDYFFPGKTFTWAPAGFHLSIPKRKHTVMKKFPKKWAATIILVALVSQQAGAFCGFYVSKADGTLKNKTSQVILVRDGEHTTVTMYNDFKGNFKDFAMVVPVPVVLNKSDIKVVDQQIFTTLNEYSQPRLVEYYDENPCAPRIYEDAIEMRKMDSAPGVSLSEREKDLGVKIEAKYLVGEYDILILSANQSTGLKTWLNENGYKIPAGAEEVLDPYIKSNLKFFVVKVNEAEKKKLPGNFLRPIQISYDSPKFMLPIRLGMANADGDQDLIVYAFSRSGRIECTNYRTVELPTGKNIPLFVQNNFSNFYANLFQHQWQKEGQSVAMLEYAWDVSPHTYLKCDPCVALAPSTQDLVQSGVWWVNGNNGDYTSDDVFFTRLHVRYNRAHFPQDLQFQVTPNTESYQARYVINHPATGLTDCPQVKEYLKMLKNRRAEEMRNLTELTGRGYGDWDLVNSEEDKDIPADTAYGVIAKNMPETPARDRGVLFATLSVVGLIAFAGYWQRKSPGA